MRHTIRRLNFLPLTIPPVVLVAVFRVNIVSMLFITYTNAILKLDVYNTNNFLVMYMSTAGCLLKCLTFLLLFVSALLGLLLLIALLFVCCSDD